MTKLTTLKPRLQTLQLTLKSVNPSSWRDGKTSAQRGYGYKWQQAREGYLRRHPLCVMCQANGRVEEATVVDHIQPHEGDMTLFWDRKNWQPVCPHCHSSVKQKMEKRGASK